MRLSLKNLFRPAIGAACVASILIVGCSSQPESFPSQRLRSAELATSTNEAIVGLPTSRPALQTFSTFSVYATPPAGWRQKVNASDPRAEHVTWTSPSGNTAFGVIFFKLPWPVGHDLAFRYGFLAEARKRDGDAEVLEKRWDPEIEGMRFKVRTPKFTVEAKFFVRGTRGWGTFAGTKTTQPVNEAEYEQAKAAREEADFGEETPATKRAADERR